MELIGKVKPEEVPADTRSRGGIWRDLFRQVQADHAEGLVTVVKVRDMKELESMRGSMGNFLRDTDQRVATTRQIQPDGSLHVYIQLVPREEEPPPSVVTRPVKRIRIGGNSRHG